MELSCASNTLRVDQIKDRSRESSQLEEQGAEFIYTYGLFKDTLW